MDKKAECNIYLLIIAIRNNKIEGKDRNYKAIDSNLF